MTAYQGKKDAREFPGPQAEDFSPWLEFERELDAWAEAGMTARFWWRDDDATRAGPRLDRLLGISGPTPIALAVIPAKAENSLAVRLESHSRQGGQVTTLQHGYAHVNHAPTGEKKAEFGDHRPLGVMLGELTAGRERMEALFPGSFTPILTPPWNRVGQNVAGALKITGLRRLSCFGRRNPREADSVLNTHIDIIDWHGHRDFVGTAQALGQAVADLSSRREGTTDREEPVGLLTHHRDHDEACWRFIEKLVAAVARHPAASWISP